MNKQLQWYPGHVSKSIREIKKIKKNIDCFILILDARAPISSFFDSFKEIIKDKNLIIFLNKSDLVEKNELKKYISFYKKEYKNVYPISSKNKSNILKAFNNAISNMNFKSLLPKFVILGIPNVGKSTILNIFTNNKQSAKIEDRAGVTKNLNWYQFNKKYWILDTPGILLPKFSEESQGIIIASIGSLKYDVIPLEKVVIEMFKIILDKKNKINFPYTEENITEKLKEELEKSNLSEPDFYKQKILNFQKLKYGKIILDDF